MVMVAMGKALDVIILMVQTKLFKSIPQNFNVAPLRGIIDPTSSGQLRRFCQQFPFNDCQYLSIAQIPSTLLSPRDRWRNTKK